ncbi:MAG: hypothetical protein AVDCRST_MAG22-3165, partial [uncultured Rubrobacteraceae bacterium]
EGAPHGRHGAARVRAAEAPDLAGPRGPLLGPRRQPQRPALGRRGGRGIPWRRGRGGRPRPGARRRRRPPARRGHRVHSLRRRRGRPRGPRTDGGGGKHERALCLRVPLGPQEADGRGGVRERARLDHRAADHDLRYRARQERPPPPALPGPFPDLPGLRPRHEPLAARLPRGLRPWGLRGPRPPRRRGTGLRPARRLTAPLRDAGRDGRPRPGEGAPPRPAAARARPPRPDRRRKAPAPAPRQERAGPQAARGQGLPLRRRAEGPRLRPTPVPRRRGPGGSPPAGGRPSKARNSI